MVVMAVVWLKRSLERRQARRDENNIAEEIMKFRRETREKRKQAGIGKNQNPS